MEHKHFVPPPRGAIGPRAMHLSKQISKCFNQALAEQGLFIGQQYILFILNDNEGITPSALANKLGVATATASISVKRMEKAGFIEKRSDEVDARITRLYPTQKAKEAPEKIKEYMDSLEEIMTSGMTPEEINTMSDLLDLAAENLMKRGDTNA